MAPQLRTAAQAAKDVVVFKALANPIRLQIVSLVASAKEGQASAGQIVERFNLSQPTISHHLKVLREAGVLTTHRVSTFVYYRFAPTLRDVVSAVLPEEAAAAPPPAEQIRPVRRTPRRTAAQPSTATRPAGESANPKADRKSAKKSGKSSVKKASDKKASGKKSKKK